MTLIYSSNPNSELNTARWHYHLARTMRRYANRGYGSMSAATRHWNIARARLKRAITGKPPRPWHDDTIPVTIGQVPASVWLTDYDPGKPAKTWGEPEDCYPATGPDVDYIVCDRDGYEAGQWLLAKVDYRELDKQVLEILERESRIIHT